MPLTREETALDVPMLWYVLRRYGITMKVLAGRIGVSDHTLGRWCHGQQFPALDEHGRDFVARIEAALAGELAEIAQDAGQGTWSLRKPRRPSP